MPDRGKPEYTSPPKKDWTDKLMEFLNGPYKPSDRSSPLDDNCSGT